MTTSLLRSARRCALALLAPLVLSMPAAAAKPVSNGLALTPPMGWSSWNNFGDSIDEKLIVETIDAMVANGMRDAGYQYVNLDDGWQRYKGNRRDRPLEFDPVRFPRGIKYLADYAHAKGMKFGIYSGPGQTTCAGYTGSEGHEAEDAKLFASWGVDHLKYDSCCSHKEAPVPVLKTIFGTMSRALMAQRRGIVLHACHCGWGQPWEWAADMGINHWRIGQDISDDFDYPGNREKYYFDVLDTLDRGIGLEKHSGPGHWNDYDMLIVGLNGRSKELVGAGASNVEYRTHFSMWAMVGSPLLAGADLRSLDADTLATFTNKEIIALNQDPLGKPAEKVRDDGVLQVYAKELADGSYAVALLNRGSATADMTLSLRRDLALTWKKYRVRDLWRHQDIGTYDIPFTTEVISHEARVLRLYPVAE
ncbi:glycoside hydrolase family 27 protein [Massilia atriviolacea]|uniref:Alpha-galactosidase n=1 Tax=Massilia atriviolacea TaxID=2495579 RepID=A0A430HTR3_9BURK|nr:glycoside hydrolase family 27 protein [Massilia atriviolacea]RSZ60855.1 glycoside hydrolase family 27 protein [Massilia atriviolacea]